MPETIEELRAEIARLECENQKLKSPSKPPSGIYTSIEGLETFAMRIGEDERILHINTAFARHLCLARKEDLIGQEASALRRFLNPEMLRAIVRPAEGESLMRMANDEHGRVFEIKTTLHAGMLDVVMQDVTEEQQFRGLVQRYILKDFDNLSEEDLRTFRFPERRFMTISFTDLRGFTALTESLNPEEVRGMVNAYYEETIRAVEENDASVIQLIGDSVMAFYGAPRHFKDHALRAIKTACEQIERVNDLCARYAQAGKEMSMCGVGINSGDVVLGNMGGAGKQAYTALGSAVNLAARLCSAARGGQVLLTEVVLNAALEVLPPGWEIVESRSLLGAEDEDLSTVRGKIEGIQALPEQLRGKVVSIGPGVRSQQNPPSFIFRYLYLLKPKGAKELPVVTVEPGRHARKSRFLSDERASTQQVEVVIGKYHIIEPIGEGGMGKVWKARDQFGNIVAIKMLSAGQGASSTQLQRFKREGDVMRKLSHHNICRIYEIGEAEGATFIAMEYIDGVSLGEVIRHNTDSASRGPRTRSRSRPDSELTDLVESIKQEKKTGSASRSGSASEAAPQKNGAASASPKSESAGSILLLPMQRVLAMMCEICEAVQFAHEHGVLHRDLKPENIMLRPDGQPVVTDFGLAKLESEEHEVSISMEGQIVGTIEYMAPEQALSSKHVTERADVYSLGAILYQLLTGRKHFESSGNLLQDAQKLQDYESPKLRQFNREIDRDLETIVLKALRPVPVQRYTSVRHTLEDLKRYQAGDSITARAPTVFDRVVKRARKYRTAVWFSAALLLLALIFGGYTLLEDRKQWGNWTEAFAVDFSQPLPSPQWMKETFLFQDKEAKPAEPWTVRNGFMVMKKQEWCWLEKVGIPDDAKVVVQLRFRDKPEAFQICINAKRKLRLWEHNPAGYSCRFGIWDGSLDSMSGNEVDRPNDFNSFRNPDQRSLKVDADGRVFTLVFQRQGERISLQVNGREVHQDTYLMPLLGELEAHGTSAGHFDSIGVRTWGQEVELRSIKVYRFKLPEKASPTVAADTLAERGHLSEALEKYYTIARDYREVTPAISSLAMMKGYLLATYLGEARIDEKRAIIAAHQRKYFLSELRQPGLSPGWRWWRRDAHAGYLQKVQEVETLMLWKDGKYSEAIASFPAIFQDNPTTRIVMECLQAGHSRLTPEVSAELLHWTAQTTNLAGLDVSSFGLSEISTLAKINSLRALDCSNNQLSDLKPLGGMDKLRALYCGQNKLVTSLEPINALKLFDLFCEGNSIENLAPLSGMPLETLYCGRNKITDLSPLKGTPLDSLGCSYNQITSLEPVAELPKLNQLYCGHNQIQTLEPLRHAKQINFLDCNSNKIDDLEPLKDLELYSLDCSGNRLVSLEPFVTARNPPENFIFECVTLRDEEIKRAIVAWTAKNLRFHVQYAQLLLKQRQERFDEIKSLGSEFGGHRYLYVSIPLDADAAKEFCRTAGGYLVRITSPEENAFLTTITPPGASCRIGLEIENGLPRWGGTNEGVNFKPESTDFLPGDRVVTWKKESWLPLAADEDKPMPFIIEWE